MYKKLYYLARFYGILQVILLFFSAASADYVIEPGFPIEVGIHTYQVAEPLSFDNVFYNSTCIIFNDTKFIINFGTSLTVTVLFVDPDTDAGYDGDLILAFDAETDLPVEAGAEFIISGLAASRNYTVTVDNTSSASVVTNAIGDLSYSYYGWSDHNFKIYYSDEEPPEPPPEPPEEEPDEEPDVDEDIENSGYVSQSIEDTITDRLQMSGDNILILLIACMCLVIAAKDLRIAIITATISYTGLFIALYQLDYNWEGAAAAFVLTIVLLSISLLLSYKKTVGGYRVV